MKKKILSIAAALIMVSACSGQGGNNTPVTSSSENTAPENNSLVSDSTPDNAPADTSSKNSSGIIKPEGEQVMPVLYINSESGKNDFVTSPVNGYVSSQIASWTPDYVIPPEPYYEKCSISITDTDGTVLLSGAESQVKVRGNWTTSYVKKPLRIKFDKKQSLLGLNDGEKFKNWVLLAEYKDLSMIRNQAAFMISDGLFEPDGLYSSDSTPVEVYINGAYWGVYLLAEQQQVSKGRVNVTEPEKDYKGTDIGYFMEYDGYFTQEDPLHKFRLDFNGNSPVRGFDGKDGTRTIKLLDYDKYEVGITIKSDIYSQEQHDFIASYVNNIYRIMYEAAYNDKAFRFTDDLSSITQSSDLTPEQAVKAVVDTNSLADMYIISEITCDADIYWSSFFMSVDLGPEGDGRLRFEAPWDFDSSLGNRDRCADGKGFYAANIVPDVNLTYQTINPWLAMLMYEPWFHDIISEKWSAAYDSGLFSRTFEMIGNSSALSPAYERNYKRWNIYENLGVVGSELSARAAACHNRSEAASYMLEWLKTRIEFLNDYWHK